MVCTRVVFDLVLDKLKSRQANRIESQVVRAARVGDRECACTHVSERHQPLPEQCTNAFVALQVDSANLAGAIVEIEVATQLLVLGFLHEGWRSRSSTPV